MHPFLTGFRAFAEQGSVIADTHLLPDPSGADTRSPEKLAHAFKSMVDDQSSWLRSATTTCRAFKCVVRGPVSQVSSLRAELAGGLTAPTLSSTQTRSMISSDSSNLPLHVQRNLPYVQQYNSSPPRATHYNSNGNAINGISSRSLSPTVLRSGNNQSASASPNMLSTINQSRISASAMRSASPEQENGGIGISFRFNEKGEHEIVGLQPGGPADASNQVLIIPFRVVHMLWCVICEEKSREGCSCFVSCICCGLCFVRRRVQKV